MTKFTTTKRTLAALLISGTALTSVASAAELTANFGATSDYIWRGMSQNAGGSSLSGGLDVDFKNGFYAGTWVGDTAAADLSAKPDLTDYGTQEVDYYAGYAGEANGLSYDIGYIEYTYPSSQSEAEADFSEAYITLGVGSFSVSYYTLVDAEDADQGDSTYVGFDYETEINGFGVALHYGNYDGDFVGPDDLSNTTLTLSKDDFSYSLVTTDGMTDADDDARLVVSWGIEF
jgi:uncharacterized protein (TIGR02001 family)